MSPVEHAATIRAAVDALNKAIAEAAKVGIRTVTVVHDITQPGERRTRECLETTISVSL